MVHMYAKNKTKLILRTLIWQKKRTWTTSSCALQALTRGWRSLPRTIHHQLVRGEGAQAKLNVHVTCSTFCLQSFPTMILVHIRGIFSSSIFYSGVLIFIFAVRRCCGAICPSFCLCVSLVVPRHPGNRCYAKSMNVVLLLRLLLLFFERRVLSFCCAFFCCLVCIACRDPSIHLFQRWVEFK